MTSPMIQSVWASSHEFASVKQPASATEGAGWYTVPAFASGEASDAIERLLISYWAMR
jgi:hypothetical protein